MKLTKTCNSCGATKPLTEYYKMTRSPDGYKTSCKDCAKKANRRCARKNKLKSLGNLETNPLGSKVCSRCGVEKLITEFGKHSGQVDGKQCYCKVCMNAARDTASLAKHRRNMTRIKSAYGITELDLQNLLNVQKGLCCICKADFGDNLSNGNGRQYHIDHDHYTGKVRGLLCGPCNMALGHIENKKINPMAFIEYQKGYQIGVQAGQMTKDNQESIKVKKNNDTTKES
jgi:hypothetical protein